MSNAEMIELAAKAAGLDLCNQSNGSAVSVDMINEWNPITSNGDALMLAAALKINISISDGVSACAHFDGPWVSVPLGNDVAAAYRMAIVLAAIAVVRPNV